jgi:hypothetical protein
MTSARRATPYHEGRALAPDEAVEEALMRCG